MYIIVYISILGLGLLSYHFLASAELEDLMVQQAVRSRIRYEFGQDIHNLTVDYKQIDSVWPDMSYASLRKVTSLNYLNAVDQDSGKHLVEHIEIILTEQARIRGIKYNLWVDKKIYTSNFNIKRRAALIDLVYHILEAWNEQKHLAIHIDINNNLIALHIVNADNLFLTTLKDLGFYVRMDNEKFGTILV